MLLPRRSLIWPLLVFLFVIIVPMICFADPPSENSVHLKDMHNHPWFWEVLVAAAVGWVIGKVKGFSGTADWIAKYWPNTPLLVVFILDLFVFVGVGAYFGTGIYNPTNFLAALGAGLSWPIGLGSIVTK